MKRHKYPKTEKITTYVLRSPARAVPIANAVQTEMPTLAPERATAQDATRVEGWRGSTMGSP